MGFYLLFFCVHDAAATRDSI